MVVMVIAVKYNEFVKLLKSTNGLGLSKILIISVKAKIVTNNNIKLIENECFCKKCLIYSIFFIFTRQVAIIL